MKAIFVVVAAALLCSCYAGEPVVLILKPLPCAVGIEYEVSTVERSGKCEYKRYNNSFINVCHDDSTNANIIALKRVDVPYAVSTIIQGDVCKIGIPATPVVEKLFSLAELECYFMEEVTWEGEKCINCTTRENGYYYNYYIKDNSVIGMGDTETLIKIKEYKFDDFREDIVLPKNCKDDSDPLPEGLYSAPAKVEECKTKVHSIDLEEFPCSYAMSVRNFYSMNFDYKKYGNNELLAYENDGVTNVILVRADIHSPSVPESALGVQIDLGNESCSVHSWNYCSPNETLVSNMIQMLRSLQIFEKTLYCDEVEDAKWKDKSCKSCKKHIEGIEAYWFVKDGHIIAVKGGGTAVEFEYEFKDFRDDFALDKNCYESSVPEDAYNLPPKEKDCESKDAASTIGVASLMIICMAMVTFFSLF